MNHLTQVHEAKEGLSCYGLCIEKKQKRMCGEGVETSFARKNRLLVLNFRKSEKVSLLLGLAAF